MNLVMFFFCFFIVVVFFLVFFLKSKELMVSSSIKSVDNKEFSEGNLDMMVDLIYKEDCVVSLFKINKVEIYFYIVYLFLIFYFWIFC